MESSLYLLTSVAVKIKKPIKTNSECQFLIKAPEAKPDQWHSQRIDDESNLEVSFIG